jgi:hypothetical protein
MAILGYIGYCIVTLWVTLVSAMIVINPFGGQGHPAEKWLVLIITGVVWFGAYRWFPFTVSMS